jgi:hypothetical protein
MQSPLIDQFIFRNFKYIAIKTINAKKQSIPSDTLIGYSIGCLDISPNETIENHKKAQTSPAAPTADNPNESAVVLMLQLFLTVLENIRQNKAETINVIPNKIATNGQPFIIRKTTNSYVGVSAPPIMPIAPF